MKDSQKLLSDFVVYNKYAKYLELEKKKESWELIVNRYLTMLLRKYPKLHKEILENSRFIYEKKVLASMRAFQFGGAAMEINNARGYNCSYLPIDNYRAFDETMFLLLSGVGEKKINK